MKRTGGLALFILGIVGVIVAYRHHDVILAFASGNTATFGVDLLCGEQR